MSGRFAAWYRHRDMARPKPGLDWAAARSWDTAAGVSGPEYALVFSGNSAFRDGGGIDSDAAMTLKNCTLSGNHVGDFGAVGVTFQVPGQQVPLSYREPGSPGVERGDISSVLHVTHRGGEPWA